MLCSHIHIEFIPITKFKTQAIHKFQPFIISDRTFEFFEIYMKHILQLRNPDGLNNDGLLFPLDMGYLFKWFMKRNFNLKFTTTSARALVETTAVEAVAEGTITQQEADAFISINGHSTATSKQYYQKYLYY